MIDYLGAIDDYVILNYIADSLYLSQTTLQERMRQKCEKIVSHGCSVFINRQLIYNLPESILAERGIMGIEHADFEGIERLAAVTGGEVVSTFDRPDLVKMGECDVVEEVRES